MSKNLSNKISESELQKAFFKYVNIMAIQNPDWQMISGNPHQGGGGFQAITRGRRMQAEGQRKGYPDITINVPRGGYHGAYIELKILKGRTSPEQKDWLVKLVNYGYLATVIATNDPQEVIDWVTSYLKGEFNTQQQGSLQ